MLTKELGRMKRHQRVRKKIFGTSERPRLSVHRSLKNLYVQVIDDTASRTLFSFSTADKNFGQARHKNKKVSASEALGKFFAPRLKEKGIKKIAFDRGGYLYHGRVKALAEALRQEGIEF
jgi:large subunit ribosomal protein L18